MQTQKDRVDAYEFMMDRLACALVLAEPSNPEVPARRARKGLLIGVILSAIMLLGFGIYGFIVPGVSTAWMKKGAILVEKETGTRFIYLAGELRPTRNQASALLVQGTGANVTKVSRASLAGVPHGAPLGIPDAPDVVPAPADLVTGPWFVCLPQGGGPNGAPPITVLADPATQSLPVAKDRYLLVSGPANEVYAVWDGVKYLLADPSVAVALGMDDVQPIPAAASWLGTVPDGKPLKAAIIKGAGSPGPDVAGHGQVVGRLFRTIVPGRPTQYYVLHKDGLAPTSATEFALMAALAPAAPPIDITVQAVAGARTSADRSGLSRLPDVVGATAVVRGTSTICVAQQPAGQRIDASVVLVEGAVPASVVPDQIRTMLPPGSGMLAQGRDTRTGAPQRYLVTDQGIRYALADDATVQALGLGSVQTVPMPQELLSAMPSGPLLSRAAAGAGK